MKSAEIQAEIDKKNALIDQEAAKGQQTNHEYIIQLRGEITQLETQLSAAKTDEASQAERTQAQEQAVESITLPYDFNDILSDGDYKVTKANDMIIEVVREFQRQSNADHNAELDQVKASYEERLKAADDREIQLQRQNSELQTALEAERQQAMQDAKDHADLLQQIAQLGMDKQDAESKRNAAVTEKEGLELLLSEKQAQIEQLRQDLANAPAPKQSIDITPTDKLAQMVKESAEQKAARGLARWNQNNPELAVAPLEFPVLPTVASSNVEQSNPVEQVTHPSEDQIPSTQPEANTSATGNQPVEQVVAATTETPTLTLESLKAELDAIKADHGARLDNIERHANLPAVA